MVRMMELRSSARLALAGLAVLLAVGGCGGAGPRPPAAAPWPSTSLHYAPNGNFSQSGQYLAGVDGFNLADISSYDKSKLDQLPDGVRGLVWLGTCAGPTASFQSVVSAFAGDPKLFGFYVMDEPSPSTCPARNLLAENTWIHAHVPGAKTFAILENRGRATQPKFAGTYTPGDSGLDLIGLDPYPVRSELRDPDYSAIAGYVRSAEGIGWPASSIVPVYQTFGGGNYADDANGHWVLPTPGQERQMLARWAEVIPHPQFDYAYSWGSQNADTGLSQSPGLQAVFAKKNK
jgi:hypothetical protein